MGKRMQNFSCAPCPEVAGYWQTFPLLGEETLPLVETPAAYTDVIVAFLAPDETGELHFTGPDLPTARDVCCLRQRGQRVLLSVGGAGSAVMLDTPDKVARFSESFVQIARRLFVNGIDIDVEAGIPVAGTPNAPEGPVMALMEAIDRVLDAMPRDFMLTMAPETANLVGGISQFGGIWGNYLPLIDHFRGRLTRVHMQYYNSGDMTGLNGQVYTPGTVDFAVAMTEAVIRGFSIADTGVRYLGLAPWQVSIGLPVEPQAAVNGYLKPGQVAQAVFELRTGWLERQPCAVAYPDLGGVMGWSVQWDATNDFIFARNAARAVCKRR